MVTSTLGEVLPDDSAFAAARVSGFILILLGTAVLSRFGGEQVAGRLRRGLHSPRA